MEEAVGHGSRRGLEVSSLALVVGRGSSSAWRDCWQAFPSHFARRAARVRLELKLHS